LIRGSLGKSWARNSLSISTPSSPAARRAHPPSRIVTQRYFAGENFDRLRRKQLPFAGVRREFARNLPGLGIYLPQGWSIGCQNLLRSPTLCFPTEPIPARPGTPSGPMLNSRRHPSLDPHTHNKRGEHGLSLCACLRLAMCLWPSIGEQCVREGKMPSLSIRG